MNEIIVRAEKLSPQEHYDFQRAELTIRNNLNGFMAAAEALVKIRDLRLYRETHVTFEKYCKEKWGFSRNYANKMIAAAAVVPNLGTIVPLPENEAQARPLTRLPPEQQAPALQEAYENARAEGRQFTARDVAAAVVKRVQLPNCGSADQANVPRPATQPIPSRAHQYAEKAISQLKHIEDDDLERVAALQSVIGYCTQKLAAEKVETMSVTPAAGGVVD